MPSTNPAPPGESGPPRDARPDTRKARGDAGEEFAAALLEARGFEVLARNWRPPAGLGRTVRGELDIVAWRVEGGRGVLCFGEVKTRSDARSDPQEAVTPSKQRQISRLAELFVALALPALLPQIGVKVAPDDVPCRFDVIEVWMPGSAPPRARLHENAFDWQG